MARIRFDDSECFAGPAAMDRSAFDATLEEAARWRDRYVADHPPPELGDAIEPGLPPGTGILHMPEQVMRAYEKHRETSLLGSVFEIANGMHDALDAIVVFGSPGANRAVKALQDACCDPYHNEQDRATRGSKPRIYFAHDTMDNDAIQSLRWRLERGGYGDTEPERHWLLILCDAANERPAVLEQLIAAQPIDCVAVSKDGDFQNPLIRGLPDRVPENLAGPTKHRPISHEAFGPLTPFALLPAAFLGLDVVQLQVGAYEICEDFKSSPPTENLVLRLASVASLGIRQRKRSAWCLWSRAFCSLGEWLEIFTSTRVVWSHEEARVCSAISMYHLVEVEKVRTDPLEGIETGREELAATLQKQWLDEGILSTRLVLPTIDTHSLGQLFQALMLTSEIMEAMCEEHGRG